MAWCALLQLLVHQPTAHEQKSLYCTLGLCQLNVVFLTSFPAAVMTHAINTDCLMCEQSVARPGCEGPPLISRPLLLHQDDLPSSPILTAAEPAEPEVLYDHWEGVFCNCHIFCNFFLLLASSNSDRNCHTPYDIRWMVLLFICSICNFLGVTVVVTLNLSIDEWVRSTVGITGNWYKYDLPPGQPRTMRVPYIYRFFMTASLLIYPTNRKKTMDN